MTVETPRTDATPPLAEVILGVHFEPFPQFTNAHLGTFWKRLGSEWPFLTDAVPLPPMAEKFGEEQVWGELSLKMNLLSNPQTRLQIRTHDRTRMIQIQNGRLHYNWMGKPGCKDYPRYEKVKAEFDQSFAKFLDFLKEESLGELRPNQWELTYINQILKGGVWTTIADCGRLFRRPEMILPRLGDISLETFTLNWHGEIPPKRGRLHLDVQHGRFETPTGPETITITLTARGPANSNSEVNSGIDRGHTVILGAFRDLTSDVAQAQWGLER
jgi:uncharacterized protein (TIGR04255 family)